MSCGSYGIAIWAMTVAPIPLVAAVRETSVLWGAAIAVLFWASPCGGTAFSRLASSSPVW